MSHTLLLADANRTIQRVIELTFAGQPVDVVTVTNGAEAIARIDAEPPDVVLADVTLPGADGYEVCGHVKHSAALAGIPVVLLTGAFEPVDEGRARAAQCDGVLAKPFDPQIVLRRVRELLGRPAGVKPAAAAAPAPAPPAAAPPTPPPPDREPPAASLDAYFEHLDASLSALASAPLPPVEPVPSSRDDSRSAPDALGPESFGATFASSGPPEPPGIAFEGPAGRAAQTEGAPSLADAFATLLDAERRSAETGGAAPAPDARLVDEVVARVIERLADQDVRNVVADVVSQVAERLIREEIARLKASLS